jgi:hypothetical protein
LLAIRQFRRSFVADGPVLYDAYEAALKLCANDTDVARALESFDPVFGTYSAAETMILCGMRDFIITLEGPHMRRARFVIPKSLAAIELRQLPNHQRYRVMAQEFDRVMP